jgi:hypothetical protein
VATGGRFSSGRRGFGVGIEQKMTAEHNTERAERFRGLSDATTGCADVAEHAQFVAVRFLEGNQCWDSR